MIAFTNQDFSSLSSLTSSEGEERNWEDFKNRIIGLTGITDHY